MSSAGPIDLRCEISSLDEPIRGRVSDGRGRSMPFQGWIEFATVLISLAEDANPRESIPRQEESR